MYTTRAAEEFEGAWGGGGGKKGVGKKEGGGGLGGGGGGGGVIKCFDRKEGLYKIF